MRPQRLSFDQLQIDGFGHFHELKLELAPGLNVLHGENGAGKSTLMAFVRSVLFGFARRHTPERYQPPGGQAFGGRVLLSTSHGELWIERLDGKRAEGELTVKNGVRAAVPESRLREALASVDRQLFEQVFAFGLDELRSWGQLMDAGKVKDALAAASVQGALRLPQALEQFEAEARGLWGKQATTRPLNLALHQLAELRARRQQLGDRPAEYFATRARLEAAALEADRLDRVLEAAAGDQFRLERLREAAPDVERAVVAAAQLAALPSSGGFPAGGLARLDEAQRAHQQAAAARARAAATAEGLQRRLEQLQRSLAGRPAPEPIGAALDGWRQVAALDAELDPRRADWAQRQRRLAEQVQRLGLAEPITAIDASASARGCLTALRARCSQAVERAGRAEEACRAATGRREQTGRELAQLQAELALPGLGAECPEQALEAARALGPLEHQAKVVEAQLEDRQTALAASAVPEEPEPIERWPGWLASAAGLGLLALAGAAFTLAGPGPGAAALGLALALSGGLLAVHRRDHSHWLAALSAHRAVARHRQQHRQRLTTELQLARARLLGLRQQLEPLRELAGVPPEGGSGPRLAKLERLAAVAGRRSELLRDAAVARSRHQSALDEVALAQAAAAQAQAEAEAAGAALAQQLLELGLPPGLAAEGALELLAEVALAQSAARALADQSDGLERDTDRVAQAAQALELAAQQAGVSGATAALLVGGLRGALDTLAGLQAEAAAVGSRREDAAAALAAAEADQAQAQARIDALLGAAQAADPEQFRLAGAAFGRRERLAGEAAQAEARVHAACGLAVEAAHAQLLIAPGLEARLEAARRAGQQLEAARREVHQQRGALAQQLTGWESDAQLGQLLQQEQALAARAEELARRFAVARLGQAVLGQAREKFEAEHQPQLVLRAGQLFGLLTAGQHPKLAFDPASGLLQAIDRQGRSFSVEQLSRGTREQLLTALRLAMIEDFGRERLALPVMIDDILVNCDPRRAERMVEALAELAGRHQVLAFTCHPQTRELFLGHGAKAIEVSTRAQLALLPS